MFRVEKLKKLRNVMTEDVQPKGSDMFAKGDDPDPNYVLTMDNAKKILAIHQRLRYLLLLTIHCIIRFKTYNFD